MRIETRHAIHYEQAKALGHDDLRRHFVIEDLFVLGEIRATLPHYDRNMLIGISPADAPIGFGPDLAELVGTDSCLERRELGLINIGGPATINSDNEIYRVSRFDVLYLGMAAQDEAILKELGSRETSNERKLYQYLVPDIVPTCQLLMGLTRLEPGNLWNTMPAHLHDRRMETYLYFDMDEGAFVNHLMGRPRATQNLIMRNPQAVLSPAQSIHCGAGTACYTFIWSMAGDNQSFADMDMVPMEDMR
ncbi:5-deoxy-glucuronate isomerase [Primorskyibacter flagellatus]|uniref:5-dehydro-4-deoxy-D-glucuronate isomerase n=1 Tax=Primorskyibacter flagellatus TaxID=1387277 RepID=A0A1W2EID1_9RHOB|nr:5-deoxy-glucuronate isomerase [Primorskyibacter flagellatus]SMD09461.1 4-deoxy-L-threo-5-hexosulose-uronate ketol-isomerase [Primorskyibacter flagellatus]